MKKMIEYGYFKEVMSGSAIQIFLWSRYTFFFFPLISSISSMILRTSIKPIPPFLFCLTISEIRGSLYSLILNPSPWSMISKVILEFPITFTFSSRCSSGLQLWEWMIKLAHTSSTANTSVFIVTSVMEFSLKICCKNSRISTSLLLLQGILYLYSINNYLCFFFIIGDFQKLIQSQNLKNM